MVAVLVNGLARFARHVARRQARRARSVGARRRTRRDRLVAGATKRRQALPDAAAVRLFDKPRVADHQHAAIGLVANQPPGALLQRDHRLRQLVSTNGLPPSSSSASSRAASTRIVGRRERQLVDDHERQRFARARPRLPRSSGCRRSTALPSAAEALEQFAAARSPCTAAGSRQPRARYASRSSSPRRAHRAQRREQQERAAARGFDHRQRRVDDRLGVARRRRVAAVRAAGTAALAYGSRTGSARSSRRRRVRPICAA